MLRAQPFQRPVTSCDTHGASSFRCFAASTLALPYSRHPTHLPTTPTPLPPLPLPLLPLTSLPDRPDDNLNADLPTHARDPPCEKESIVIHPGVVSYQAQQGRGACGLCNLPPGQPGLGWTACASTEPNQSPASGNRNEKKRTGLLALGGTMCVCLWWDQGGGKRERAGLGCGERRGKEKKEACIIRQQSRCTHPTPREVEKAPPDREHWQTKQNAAAFSGKASHTCLLPPLPPPHPRTLCILGLPVGWFSFLIPPCSAAVRHHRARRNGVGLPDSCFIYFFFSAQSNEGCLPIPRSVSPGRSNE